LGGKWGRTEKKTTGKREVKEIKKKGKHEGKDEGMSEETSKSRMLQDRKTGRVNARGCKPSKKKKIVSGPGGVHTKKNGIGKGKTDNT